MATELLPPVRVNQAERRSSRRQYQSCDQCRHGRRACNASTLGLHLLDENIESPTPNASSPNLMSCSTCAKTGKRCTFNWLRSLPGEVLPRSRRKGKGVLERREDIRPTSQAPTSSSGDDFTPRTMTPPFDTGPGTFESHNFNLYPTADVDASAFQTTQYDGSDFLGDLRLQFHTSKRTGVGQAYEELGSFASQLRPGRNNNTNLDDINSHILWQPDGHFDFNTPTINSNDYITNLQPPTQDVNLNYSINMAPQIPTPHNWLKEGRMQDTPRLRRQTSSASDSDFGGLCYHIADEANKKMIASNLMRIYHDSLENALSSWLSEKTCPYSIEIRNSASRIIDEWGPSWSNRICIRVCQLDSAFSRMRRRPFTTAENCKASRVLNTTIMAFASQWSQTTPQCSSGVQSNLLDSHLDQDSVAATDRFDFSPASDKRSLRSPRGDFDRSLQRDLWYAARKSLQEAAEMDSFKIIFAHMIFGLIQRPLESDERVRTLDRKHVSRFNQSCHDDTQQSVCSNDATTTTTTAAVVLDNLVDLQGPPIYLEVALRHLFSWRTRIERHRHLQAKSRSMADPPHNSVPDAVHRKSFNLLFWFGVMCDTTSSAINQRPLVISDEDSGILTLDADLQPQEDIVHSTWTSSRPCRDNSNLWGSFLLNKKRRAGIPRWPCAPDEAAATLCEATPMKVLLYRRVARLQTLCYRRASPSELEHCVESALAVYHEWNSLYRQFMLDCVAYHDELPPRIQSWYVILSCHWFLACLLLADIIETIDHSNRRLDTRTSPHKFSDVTANLRKQNASAIAAVADASARSKSKYGRPEEFHFAISDAALLSEPWTDILMRSFTKAADALLQMIERDDVSGTACHIGRGWEDGRDEIWRFRRDAMACIQGLKVLGRKSEMADILATVLFEDLDHCLSSSFQLRNSAKLGMGDGVEEPPSVFIRDICDLVMLENECEGEMSWEI